MQNLDGGFGGGHGQTSHCAPSYAVILSLAMVGGHDTFDVINRKTLWVPVHPFPYHPLTNLLLAGSGLVSSNKAMAASRSVLGAKRMSGTGFRST